MDLSRTYRIGFGLDRPFHFPDAGGRPRGLAVEIVQAAAERSGIRLEWVLADSGVAAVQSNSVDLYVLTTIRPERRMIAHLTDPYLITETSFLVRADSKIQQPRQLTTARISFIDVAIHRTVLGELFPKATIVPLQSTLEAIQAVRDGRADAAYVDQFAAVTALLDGLVREPLRIVGAGTARGVMGLSSKFEAAPVAEKIREEMRAMVKDGTMSHIVEHWGFFPSLTSEAIDALSAEQRRVERLRAGLAGLVVLLLWAGWLALRLRHETAAVRQAEEELRRREQHHRMLVDLLPDTLYMVGRDGGLSLSGQASANNSQEELLTALEQSDRHREKVQEVLSTGASVVAEEAAGESRFVEYRLVPVRGSDGKPVGAMGILRDVTERRKSEQARAELEEQLRESQKLDSIGRLAGGIAHDFNNLLTVINGYSEMVLASAPLSGVSRRQVEGIHMAGTTAAELTQQLLAFGRKQVVQVQSLDVNGAIREQEGLVRRMLGEGISLVQSLRPSKGVVMADPAQISQILLNLSANARDAMRGRRVSGHRDE